MIKEIFMVPPTYCDVDYSINPWMKEKPRISVLEKQWQNLFDVHVDLFGKSKVHKLEAKPENPELCFCGDSVFLINGKAIFGNFLHKERAKERDVIKDVLRPFEFEYFQVPADITYEGSGETLMVGDKILLGYGQRTHKDVKEYIEKWTGKQVIDLRLMDERFFHLDTALLPLKSDEVMLYAPAFDEAQLGKLTAQGLKRVFLDEPFAMGWPLNSVVHGNKMVVHSGATKTIPHLKELGFDVIEVDVSEFLKLGGGVKCLTLMHHQV